MNTGGTWNICEVADIKHCWRRYERLREMSAKYIPPPPKNKSRFPALACTGAKSKVAAIGEVAVVDRKEDERKKRERKNNENLEETQSI